MSRELLCAEPARPMPVGRLLIFCTFTLLIAGYGWLHHESLKSEMPELPDCPSLARLRSMESLVDEGEAAVPHLIELLSSREPVDRALAAMGLMRLGPIAEPAVAALADHLDDEDPQVRAHVLLALGKINSGLDEVVPRIVRRLSDTNLEVRRNAAHALIAAGPAAAPRVIEALEQPEFVGIEQAITVLRHVADDVDATRTALRRLLSDDLLTRDTREDALEALLAIGGATREEIRQGLAASRPAAFRMALSAASRTPRELATWMPLVVEQLSTFRPYRIETPSPVPDPLQHGRRVSDSSHPAQVLRILCEIGPSASDAIPEVCRLVECESVRDDLRLLGIRTLSKIGADRSKYVSELVRAFVGARYFPSDDEFEADRMGDVLRELAPEQVPILVNELSLGLRSPDSAIRMRTFALFREFGPAAVDALPEALKLLRTGNDSDRWSALKLLAAIGPEATPALADLAELLRPPSARRSELLTGEIVRALGQIGPAAAPILPDLIDVLGPARNVYSTPCTIDADNGPLGALMKIAGNDEVVVVDFFRSGLSDPNPFVRLTSAARLIEIETELDRVIALLVDEVEHPVSLGPGQVCRSCSLSAQLLARLGGRARSALDPLTIVLQSATAEQQHAAAMAIASIAGSDDGLDEGGHSAAARAVKPLIELLKARDQSHRRIAAQALGALGRVAEPAIPALEAALGDRRNFIGFGRDPYGSWFCESDYVSPVFRSADRSKYSAAPTVAEEIQMALRKISGNFAMR